MPMIQFKILSCPIWSMVLNCNIVTNKFLGTYLLSLFYYVLPRSDGLELFQAGYTTSLYFKPEGCGHDTILAVFSYFDRRKARCY